MNMLIRVTISAIALWVATVLVGGIDVTADTTGKRVGTLIAVAVIFGVVNGLLKPIIHVLGCLFYILTLGLFALVVNALLFELTSYFADKLDLPFKVDGFWPAFWGAIIVGVVSWFLNMFVGDRVESDD